MEEIKARYFKIIIVFFVIITTSTISLRGLINTMTKTQNENTKIENIKKELADSSVKKIDEENVTEKDIELSTEITETIAELRYNQDMAINRLEEIINESSPSQKIKIAELMIDEFEQKDDTDSIIKTINSIIADIPDDIKKAKMYRILARSYVKKDEIQLAQDANEKAYKITHSLEDLNNFADNVTQTNDTQKLQEILILHLANFPEDKEELSKYNIWLEMQNSVPKY